MTEGTNFEDTGPRALSQSLVGLGILKSSERLKANSSVVLTLNPMKTPDTADVIGYDSPADQNLRINQSARVTHGVFKKAL